MSKQQRKPVKPKVFFQMTNKRDNTLGKLINRRYKLPLLGAKKGYMTIVLVAIKRVSREYYNFMPIVQHLDTMDKFLERHK